MMTLSFTPTSPKATEGPKKDGAANFLFSIGPAFAAGQFGMRAGIDGVRAALLPRPAKIGYDAAR